MDAISLSHIEHLDAHRSRDKTNELWDHLVERFLFLAELPIETGWAIGIAIVLFLLILLGIYVTGWEHVATGP